MATEMATATLISATVSMLSSQRPMAPKYRTPAAVRRPARSPSTDVASMAAAAATAYQGSHSKRRSTVRRAQSMESLIGLKKNEKLQWVVLVVDHPTPGTIDPIGQSNGPGLREALNRAEGELGRDDPRPPR